MLAATAVGLEHEARHERPLGELAELHAVLELLDRRRRDVRETSIASSSASVPQAAWPIIWFIASAMAEGLDLRQVARLDRLGQAHHGRGELRAPGRGAARRGSCR